MGLIKTMFALIGIFGVIMLGVAWFDTIKSDYIDTADYVFCEYAKCNFRGVDIISYNKTAQGSATALAFGGCETRGCADLPLTDKIQHADFRFYRSDIVNGTQYYWYKTPDEVSIK